MEHSLKLKAPVHEELVKEFLGRMRYVSEDLASISLDREARDRVTFTLRESPRHSPAEISERIDEVARKLVSSRSGATRVCMRDRLDRKVPFEGNPYEILAERGEVKEYGPGRIGVGPTVVGIIEFFEAQILDVARQFEARPHRFPTLIGADSLHRCGYLKSFPHTLTLVTHLREDLRVIESFAQSADCRDGSLSIDPEDVGKIRCLLAPAICLHYYPWLQDTVTSAHAITAGGREARYESGNFRGLERMWEYSGREVVFVGPPDYVLAGRKSCMERFTLLFDELGMAYSIESATDPFFVDDYADLQRLQEELGLKLELRAMIPYLRDTMALGSSNYHMGFFGKSFNITLDGDKTAHTACVGFGFERLALGFLAQFGCDRARWPAMVRNFCA